MLIEACIKGDRKAQYEVYQLYSKAMFNICYRITNHLEEAEDILQEAFLKAFRNMEQYRSEATFGAWLKRIVIHQAINHMKKKKLTLVDMEQHGIKDLTTSDSGNFTEMTLEVNKVRKNILKLPDGYRIVLSLYLLEGYDHKEIGTVLGVTESTSKSQYNRAKKRLREIIKEKYQYER